MVVTIYITMMIFTHHHPGTSLNFFFIEPAKDSTVLRQFPVLFVPDLL
jgi:hypothetical protein